MPGYEERVELFRGDTLDRRFARGPGESAARVEPLARIEARLAGIDSEVCQRLVLSGGNPLSHPDFAGVVAAARARGLGGITVQCVGSALEPEGTAERLVELGVEQVEVYLAGLRAKVHEAVLDDPGGHRAAFAGLARALAAGLTAHVSFPLLRANAADAVPLVEYLVARAKPAGFFLALPRLDDVPRPYRPLLLRASEASRIAAAVFDVCRRNGLELGFTDRQGITPCAAPELDAYAAVFHQRIRWLEHLDGSQLRRVTACATCSLASSCPGVEASYVEQFGDSELAPVPLERSMAWRLKRINRREAHDYKNVSAFDNQIEGRGRSLLRVNGHCQMACSFCFVDRTVPDFDAGDLEREIDAFAREQTEHLVLSGGEPTMHPELPRLLRHARSLGFTTIEIQTNGIKLRVPAYADELVAAGLSKATVSLHSQHAELSDEITKLNGAFPHTLAGLTNLRRLGVEVQIAHVITKANYRELPDFVRFLAARLPREDGHLSVCFAIAQGISDLVYTWVLPSFSEIKPFMREALDLCHEAGIGFGGMIGQGGYPPCMLDGNLDYYRDNFANIYHSADHDRQFYKAERCRECSFDPYCVGVRRDYVQHFGDEEIAPFVVTGDALAGLAPLAAPSPVAPHAGHMPRPRLVPLRRKVETPA